MKTIASRIALFASVAWQAGAAQAHEAAGHVHKPGDGLVHLMSGGDGALAMAGGWLLAAALVFALARGFARRG